MLLLSDPRRCLRDAPGKHPAGSPAALPELGQREAEWDDAFGAARVVCYACGAFIAPSTAHIDVNGGHTHTFVNPAGEIFRIRCFSEAPGALPIGPTSEYWTWFPGFSWQACLCRACLQHLGWSYRNAASSFVGLIADRIRESGEPLGPAS